MGYLGGREQLGCGVGADRHAGAATDAGRRVESGLGYVLGGEGVQENIVSCCPRKDHVVTPRC